MELELALNEVTEEGARALAAALARLPRLQRLNLRENELDNPGAIAIAKALTGLKDLRELDLTQNQVRKEPVSVLCALQCCGRACQIAWQGMPENDEREGICSHNADSRLSATQTCRSSGRVWKTSNLSPYAEGWQYCEVL